MKRAGWMLLLSLIALLGLGCAWAEEAPAAGVDCWPGEIVRMNIDSGESVAMYDAPDASARVVAQLEPGSFLRDCRREPGGFVRCETEEEVVGYVSAEHLIEPAFRVRMAGAAGEDAAMLDGISDFSAERWESVRRIPVRCADRELYCATDYQRLCVSCFDGGGRFVWGLYTDALDSVTEDTAMDAFAGGEPDGRATVCVTNAKLGLAAIDVETGALRWTIDRGGELLGGEYACGSDGVLYIECMELEDMARQVAAISPDGERLWVSAVPRAAGWLCGISLEGDRVVAEYADENLEEHAVWLDVDTGEVLAVEPDDL